MCHVCCVPDAWRNAMVQMKSDRQKQEAGLRRRRFVWTSAVMTLRDTDQIDQMTKLDVDRTGCGVMCMQCC